MSWLPDIPSLFTSLERIENNEDLLKDSTDLFWLFCNGIMNPEEFKERLDFWKREDSEEPKNWEWTDRDLESLMFDAYDNPEKATGVMIDRFDALINKKSLPYIPDEPDASVEALYVYLHLEAAQLFRLLKTQGYSEKTRECLEITLSAYTRCKRSLSNLSESPWPLEYSISLEAVASFLFITRFFIQKSEGHYEEALDSLIGGLQHIRETHTIYSNNVRLFWTSGIHFHYFNHYKGYSYSDDFRSRVPWMKDISHQLFVDCFEAIRRGESIKDAKRLTQICEELIDISDETWLSNDRYAYKYTFSTGNIEISNGVTTEGFYWDHASDYWQYAVGWIEAQLTPSEFKKIINEREEQAAEERLKRYFFNTHIWNKLPEKSKKSLISADRDWFSGPTIRKEAILNNLRIAIEGILIQFFWKPLVLWVEQPGGNKRGAQELVDFKAGPNDKWKTPSIWDLEHICRMPITGAFLVDKQVPREDRVWFINGLPNSLYPLRQSRNVAEHEMEREFIDKDIISFYEEFIGIGQPGVIKKLYLLLESIDN